MNDSKNIVLAKFPTKFLVLFICLLALVIGSVFFLFRSIEKATEPINRKPVLTKPLKLTGTNVPELQPDGKTVILSVNPVDPQVVKFNIAYIFIAKLLEIKETPEGKELVIDTNLENMPRILVNPRTRFFYKTGPTDWHQVSLKDLKIGQTLRVNLFYLAYPPVWELEEVYALMYTETGEEARSSYEYLVQPN